MMLTTHYIHEDVRADENHSASSTLFRSVVMTRLCSSQSGSGPIPSASLRASIFLKNSPVLPRFEWSILSPLIARALLGGPQPLPRRSPQPCAEGQTFLLRLLGELVSVVVRNDHLNPCHKNPPPQFAMGNLRYKFTQLLDGRQKTRNRILSAGVAKRAAFGAIQAHAPGADLASRTPLHTHGD